MENNEDNRQMTVIAEAIHILNVEISNWSVRRYNASHSMSPRSTELEDAAIEKREYAKGILESLLPKEKKQREADWIDGFIKDLSPSIFDDGLRGMMKYAELRYNQTFKTT